MATAECTGLASEVHHRNRDRSDNRVDNLLDCCGPDHRWIHANPAAAYELRLLLHQWDEVTPLRRRHA